MQITLTIPNNKLVEFKIGFLAMCPIPVEKNEEGILLPSMTELEWFKKFLKQITIKVYRQGKLKLAQENAQIDENIIE